MNNELLDLELQKGTTSDQIFVGICQRKSEFLRGKFGSAPQITSGKFPTFLTPVWLLAPASSDLPNSPVVVNRH